MATALDDLIAWGATVIVSWPQRTGMETPMQGIIDMGYQSAKYIVEKVSEAAWFNADSLWTARWQVYFENVLVVNDSSSMIAYSSEAPPRVLNTKDEVEISHRHQCSSLRLVLQ